MLVCCGLLYIQSQPEKTSYFKGHVWHWLSFNKYAYVDTCARLLRSLGYPATTDGDAYIVETRHVSLLPPKHHKNCPSVCSGFMKTYKAQKPHVQAEFKDRSNQVVTQFAEQVCTIGRPC